MLSKVFVIIELTEGDVCAVCTSMRAARRQVSEICWETKSDERDFEIKSFNLIRENS